MRYNSTLSYRYPVYLHYHSIFQTTLSQFVCTYRCSCGFGLEVDRQNHPEKQCFLFQTFSFKRSAGADCPLAKISNGYSQARFQYFLWREEERHWPFSKTYSYTLNTANGNVYFLPFSL